jgi:hypothetical protein
VLRESGDTNIYASLTHVLPSASGVCGSVFCFCNQNKQAFNRLKALFRLTVGQFNLPCPHLLSLFSLPFLRFALFPPRFQAKTRLLFPSSPPL